VKVLITGAGGQLGRALVRTAPRAADVTAVSHAELDIADADAVAARVLTGHPDIVINAAAFTQVDAAESDPAGAERANVDGVRALADACQRGGAWLIHVSTDYVFDGARTSPYRPTDAPRPLSVYGHTKWAGECCARATLPHSLTIVRTSWLYSATGRNFVTRMLELMARSSTPRVVNDQVGAPTDAAGLAGLLWKFASSRVAGTYHWSDAGTATWYQFAVAIAEESVSLGLLPRSPEVVPISTAEYPTPARRPRYSVLDRSTTETALGCRATGWRDALKTTLTDIVRERARGPV